MSTILQRKAKCVQGMKIEWYPVAASQTWYGGQFVYLNAYGRMTQCSSSATTTCGMAASDNSSATIDYLYPVYVPTELALFEMNTYHSTPASATTTISMVGQSYNYFSATVGAYCNRSATTAPFFHVVKLSEKDKAGDLFGKVIVNLVPEVCQLFHNAS